MQKVQGRVVGLIGKRAFVWYGIFYSWYFGLLLLFSGLVREPSVVLNLRTVWFLLAGLLGMGIGLVDRLVYVFWTWPQAEVSVSVKTLFLQRRWRAGLHVLFDRRGEMVRLSSNNLLFVTGWMITALYLMTSSNDIVARGLVLGVGLQILYALVIDWQNKEFLRTRLSWPLARPLEWGQTKMFAVSFLMVFVAVSLMAV